MTSTLLTAALSAPVSLVAAQGATPAPTPSGQTGPDPASVSPGTIGFVVTLIIAIAAILLARDALRRVRRVRARAGVETTYSIPMRGAGAVPNRSDLGDDRARAAGDGTAAEAADGDAGPARDAGDGPAEPGTASPSDDD